ncbi:MAG TPA: circadian clock protein KaiC, partial [Brevundimonas sp.]|nr:circadian clock protein KaiC [Brevundimonas sp.]
TWPRQVLKAVSVIKSRTTDHETSIREFLLTGEGAKIGNPLADFEGVLTGLPNYRGRTPMMSAEPAAAEG